MTPELVEPLTDLQAVALTMYGEARGDGRDGSSLEERVAVGCVIRNRRLNGQRFGRTFKAVCLQRAQFSCWWEFGGRENYRHMQTIVQAVTGLAAFPQLPIRESDLLMECQFLADGIVGGMLRDITHGATHYMTRHLYEKRTVVWAQGLKPSWEIGSHVFFAGVA